MIGAQTPRRQSIESPRGDQSCRRLIAFPNHRVDYEGTLLCDLLYRTVPYRTSAAWLLSRGRDIDGGTALHCCWRRSVPDDADSCRRRCRAALAARRELRRAWATGRRAPSQPLGEWIAHYSTPGCGELQRHDTALHKATGAGGVHLPTTTARKKPPARAVGHRGTRQRLYRAGG